MRLKEYNFGARLMLRNEDLAILGYSPKYDGDMVKIRHIIKQDGTSELACYTIHVGTGLPSTFEHSTPTYSHEAIQKLTILLETLGKASRRIHKITGDYDLEEYSYPPHYSIRFWHGGNEMEHVTKWTDFTET